MMKRVLFLSLLLAAACAPKDGIRTLRTAEGQEADLGKIKEIEGPVTVRLVAKNVYPDTLYPVQLYTPCGCTEAKFDRKPVPPGADEVLEVTYNPAYRPGPMREEIQVRYQHSPVNVRTFAIKGEVIGFNHPIEEDRPYAYGEGLYMSHKVLSYGALRPGETGDFFFRHGNGKGEHRLRHPRAVETLPADAPARQDEGRRARHHPREVHDARWPGHGEIRRAAPGGREADGGETADLGLEEIRPLAFIP